MVVVRLPDPEARGPRSLAGPQEFYSKATLHVYSHMGPWSLVLPMLVVVVVVVVIVWRVIVVSPGSLSAHVFAAHVRTAMEGFRALLEGPCDVECGLVGGELEMRRRVE